MTEARTKTAVLISGRGSNLAALIAAARQPDFPARIVLVVSNVADAPGLEIARSAGIVTEVVDHRRLRPKLAFESQLNAVLRSAGTELVCLAGFMRILSPGFVEAWRDAILNIHPSLLPAYPGLDTHARAIASGARTHGATVHFVRAETDAGPIIMQEAVPVLPGDTPETLAARVLEAEHRIYPAALRLVASGRAVLSGDRVLIDGVGVAPVGPARR